MLPPEDETALRLSALIDRAWAATALAALGRGGALGPGGVQPRTAAERAAAEVLAAAGLGDVSSLASAELVKTAVEGTVSSIRQMLMAIDGTGSEGWAAQDDETLLAQGRASAMGGAMLARMAVPALEGLSARFDGPDGGVFLDVGVGVGELTAAFCDALPTARVIGLDVMPRVLELARRTIADRGLADRVDLRLVGVQDLTDEAVADLAWLPGPFIPEDVFDDGLVALHRALRPGGWLVLAGGRLDGDDALAVAVTRWKTVLAGGTPLPRADVDTRLTTAGFGPPVELPSLPTGPALSAARRA
jgi:SAM-dependent methyltransferase